LVIRHPGMVCGLLARRKSSIIVLQTLLTSVAKSRSPPDGLISAEWLARRTAGRPTRWRKSGNFRSDFHGRRCPHRFPRAGVCWPDDTALVSGYESAAGRPPTPFASGRAGRRDAQPAGPKSPRPPLTRWDGIVQGGGSRALSRVRSEVPRRVILHLSVAGRKRRKRAFSGRDCATYDQQCRVRTSRPIQHGTE